MKKITLEQAKKYVPLDDDMVNRELHRASYYTMSPYPNSEMDRDGWRKLLTITLKEMTFMLIGEKEINGCLSFPILLYLMY